MVHDPVLVHFREHDRVHGRAPVHELDQTRQLERVDVQEHGFVQGPELEQGLEHVHARGHDYVHGHVPDSWRNLILHSIHGKTHFSPGMRFW